MICIENDSLEFEVKLSKADSIFNLETIKDGEFYKSMFKKELASLFISNLNPFNQKNGSTFSLIKEMVKDEKENKCTFYPISFWKELFSVSVENGVSTYMKGEKEAKLKFFELSLADLEHSLNDFDEFDYQLEVENNDGYVFFSETGNWSIVDSNILNCSIIAFFNPNWKINKKVIKFLKADNFLDMEGIKYIIDFSLNKNDADIFFKNYGSVLNSSILTIKAL